MRRARRTLTIWMAVLAVLMTTLAPAIAHALDVERPASWTEICSAGGTVRVVVDDGTDAPADHLGPASLLDHCPYCSLQADAFPVPPSLPTVAAPMPPGRLVPPAFLHADRTLAVWSSAQPRAPPVLS